MPGPLPRHGCFFMEMLLLFFRHIQYNKYILGENRPQPAIDMDNT